MIEKEKLILTIQESFSAVPYPSGGRLVVNNTPEALEIEEKIANIKWNDLSVKFMKRYYYAYCWMTNEAYRYFLPGFMLQIVLNYDKAGSAVDSIVSSLTMPTKEDREEVYKIIEEGQKLHPLPEPLSNYFPPDETFEQDAEQARFLERVCGFSLEQKHAILLFLEYLKGNHSQDFPRDEVEKAICRFWSKFKEGQK